ncbi:MAG: 4Fe-4S binding protein [Methanobrevibacter sp.]|nr:4Fe-4S binding protein [Candidatus Methanovirga aequatorialis]
MPEIEVNFDDCDSCGECVDVCPMEIFSLEGDVLSINHPDECIDCKVCVDVCPNGCISVN